MDPKKGLPLIPPVDDVAVARPDAVPEVPASVAVADPVTYEKLNRVYNECVAKDATVSASKAAKRQPVDHQSHRLNWKFIRLMGKIAHYASEKYGSVEQYTDSRLEGEKSPMNHIVGHIEEYSSRKPHDKFGNLEMQLAAIAYNAMMEYWYLTHGGPTIPEDLYK